jgi:hypothetical protein
MVIVEVTAGVPSISPDIHPCFILLSQNLFMIALP